MNKQIDLVDLLERNVEIERTFNQRLENFNKNLEIKEREIKRLEELIAKEKKQYIANRLFNKGTLQRNQDLNNSFKKMKEKIKTAYTKLDQNNDRINEIISYMENSRQVGGGDEEQVMEYLDKIELELKKNINRINYIEKGLKNFIDGKDVELQKVSQVLDQVLESSNNNQQSDKNYDQEAEKIINVIENIENNISL